MGTTFSTSGEMNGFDSKPEVSKPYFDIGTIGYGSFFLDEKNQAKSFEKTTSVNGIACPSFAGAIVKHYNSRKYKNFMKRRGNEESFNFQVDEKHFKRINYTDVLDSTKNHSIFKDKIVLIGYLGKNYIEKKCLHGDEDVCLIKNPKNEESKRVYASFLWAHIIEMILNESYAD